MTVDKVVKLRVVLPVRSSSNRVPAIRAPDATDCVTTNLRAAARDPCVSPRASSNPSGSTGQQKKMMNIPKSWVAKVPVMPTSVTSRSAK